MRSFSLVILFFIQILVVHAQLRLAELFSDHMVIQRDVPVNVWGYAAPNAMVKVDFLEFTKEVNADPEGRWKIPLPAISAGGPYDLGVVSGKESIVIHDVFVGDVWLCSGQSNMEWIVGNSDFAETAVQEARDQLIRHIKVPHAFADEPSHDLPECQWVVNDPQTVSDFTAVGYYFARELRKHANVPIGLLNSSWGGSRIEAWMSAEVLGMEDPSSEIRKMKEQAIKESEKQREFLRKKFPGLGKEDLGMEGEKAIWADPDHDDSGWIPFHVPQLWEEQGLQGFDGIGWYRIYVELNAAEAEKEAVLHLAKIDDSDQVWVNGTYIGGMSQAWDRERVYNIPPGVLAEGKNIIVVRVEDTGGGGGIYGEASNVFLKTTGRDIPLSGKHKFKAGSILSLNPMGNPHQTPTMLYNSMIHPILMFPLKGVIWYQGESNADNAADAENYRILFKDMITSWRNLWGQPDLPFLYVQLANFTAPDATPSESNWALLRESQRESLELENVGEAVIIDIGEADDIHPRNKHDVGYRLSLPARKWAYGEDIVYSGPEVMRKWKKDGKILIEFDQEIEVRNKYGYVNGFAIAGADRNFYWAQAAVKGNIVTIWKNDISDPLYIRYGWANNPGDLNLYNKTGLPVSPFRLKLD